MSPELDRERFERFVIPEPNSGCHLWMGSGALSGHGQFRIGARNDPGRPLMAAHRFAWLLAGREIPPGLCVLHKCDMPPCVNPDHLYVGTHQDNMNDVALRARGSKGRMPYGARRVLRGGRFWASIGFQGRQIYLGTYATAEEASAAAVAHRREVRGHA